MRLFYFLNGLAGQSDVADAMLRFYAVCAVPLLATGLAAALFWPRSENRPSRGRVALAAILATCGCALAVWLANAFAAHFLGTDTLSPRPFVTHRVNALIVEPNDTSFPCAEVMLAAALAVLIWAVIPRAALGALLAAALLGVTRLICGANYPIDIVAGLALGAILGALALAFCGVPLGFQTRRASWKWRPAYQAASCAVLFFLVAAATLPQANSALYSAKMSNLWGVDTRAGSKAETTRDVKEGEGAAGNATESASQPGSPRISVLSDVPAPGVTELGGHLPIAERGLLAALGSAKLLHRLVSIDVAQIKIDGRFYRCAAVRFEVAARGATERHRVAQTAAFIVRRAFKADSQLQNVDVTGVVLNVPRAAQVAAAKGAAAIPVATATRNDLVFALGAVPVFTASVQRARLLAQGALTWTNLPGANAGSWLRARSRLYINPRVLPERDAPIPTPTPKPTAVPTAVPTATPTISPTATPTVSPTATPQPTIKPTPAIAPPPQIPIIKTAPTAKPKPTVIPTVRPTARPTAKPFVPRVAPKFVPRKVQPRPRTNAKPRTIKRAVRRSYRKRRVYRRYRQRYRRFQSRRTVRSY